MKLVVLNGPFSLVDPDTDMQRRAQIGLNKGEPTMRKNALRIGEGKFAIATEGQHYRIAGLNLLTAVIIYWNTVHLGHAVTERRNEGLDVPLNFFPTYPHWAGRTFY